MWWRCKVYYAGKHYQHVALPSHIKLLLCTTASYGIDWRMAWNVYRLDIPKPLLWTSFSIRTMDGAQGSYRLKSCREEFFLTTCSIHRICDVFLPHWAVHNNPPRATTIVCTLSGLFLSIFSQILIERIS